MNNTFEITGIKILEDNNSYYGPDQHWYKKRMHAMSGCGPTTASIAMAHLAQSVDSCAGLYPYDLPFVKDEFTKHMEDVRLFIKPNFGSMTNADAFGSRCSDYAKTKSVDMKYKIMDKSLDSQKVFEKVIELLDKNILPSLLILRNPHKEINDFTWHWMSITGYFKETNEISVATYGKKYKMDFTKVWNQKKMFSTDIVWFF